MKRVIAVGFGIVGLGVLASSAPALAGPRDDVLYGISRCGGIADDRTWLDCVYGAAQPMRAQLGLPPAPASQLRLVPPAMPGMAVAAPAPRAPAAQAMAAPPPPPAERPGFFTRMLTPTHENPEPPTRMTAYKFDAAGHFSVTLANGETWEQDIGDDHMARWNKPAQTYTVTIEPSSSNYHYLKVGTEKYMVYKD
jgi:hypothetical protein